MADNGSAGPFQIDGALSSPAHDKLRRLRRQDAAWRGEAPSGFRTVIPGLTCGLFAPGDALFDSSTKLDFHGSPVKGTQVEIDDFTMDLDLDLLVLIDHSLPLP